ncbi:MAG: hypothetical protein IPP66_10725 [Anaerolineales bacterium]|nr:hypothetical protein [Anaerolineales bacterium]
MDIKKSLVDLTKDEIHDRMRAEAKNVAYSYNDYRDELFHRSQDEHTRALNKWTKIMSIATVVVALVTICNVVVIILTTVLNAVLP